MNRLTTLALVSCAIALGSPQALAQGGLASGANRVTVNGTVFSESNNQRVSQASVRLCDSGGTEIAETIANDSGEFFFRGIERNTYILTVSAPGFQPQDMHLDLSFMSDRGISVVLKPVPGTSPPPTSASRISAHEMSMPQSARDLVQSGEKKLYHDNNPQGGIQDLQQAIAVAPGYYEAAYQVGMAYVAMGNNDEAEKAFRHSIEISGDKYGEADVGLGTLLLNKGDTAGGEKTVRRGIELSPGFWLGYYELGRALLIDKQVPDAGKAAEQARSLAPASPLVYRLLANVHLAEKNYPALLQDLDAYIKLDPDSPAGARAKELRAQFAQKMAAQTPPTAVAATK
jgi:Tfp pilus assembly protein PilF